MTDNTPSPALVDFVIKAGGGAEQAARNLGYLIRVERTPEDVRRYYATIDLETPALYGYHASREDASRSLLVELLTHKPPAVPPEVYDVIADVLRAKDAQGYTDEVLDALARAGFKVTR